LVSIGLFFEDTFPQKWRMMCRRALFFSGLSLPNKPRGNTMNHRIALGIAMLAGVAIGATVVNGLHAQGKAPGVYAVVEINDITDPEGFKVVTQRPAASTATVMQGGHYIARTDKINALDGTPPKRYVLIAFDSAEAAQAWNNSADQQKINAIRDKTTKSRVFIVEAMAQ
jgi:uncharacterized protein (DUF1330 family)